MTPPLQSLDYQLPIRLAPDPNFLAAAAGADLFVEPAISRAQREVVAADTPDHSALQENGMNCSHSAHISFLKAIFDTLGSVGHCRYVDTGCSNIQNIRDQALRKFFIQFTAWLNAMHQTLETETTQ